MPVTIETTGKKMVAALQGDIDHHGAKALRETIDAALEKNRPSLLVLDFRDVGFMDSSGIGLVMGRYRLVQQFGGGVEVHNPLPSIKKVMRLAGLDRIAPIIMTPPEGKNTDEKTEATV